MASSIKLRPEQICRTPGCLLVSFHSIALAAISVAIAFAASISITVTTTIDITVTTTIDISVATTIDISVASAIDIAVAEAISASTSLTEIAATEQLSLQAGRLRGPADFAGDTGWEENVDDLLREAAAAAAAGWNGV